MKPKIDIGSLVSLKCGGCYMIAEYRRDGCNTDLDEWRCVWMNTNMVLQRAWFREEVLDIHKQLPYG